MKRRLRARPLSLPRRVSFVAWRLGIASMILIASAATGSARANPASAEEEAPLDASAVTPRPWSLGVSVGIQALGFAPTPANPQASVGAEVGLVSRGFYQFRIGSELGFFYQDQFSHGATLDLPLVNRFTTPWGVYADLDAVVGAGVSWINTPTYRRVDGGQYKRSAPPAHPHARLGLGAALGFDLRQVSGPPVRIFLSYRQLVLTPFMPKNDVPLMGLAALSLGVAVEMN